MAEPEGGPGGGGAAYAPHIFADQLTLSQPGVADYAPPHYHWPPRFSDLPPSLLYILHMYQASEHAFVPASAAATRARRATVDLKKTLHTVWAVNDGESGYPPRTRRGGFPDCL